MLKWLNRDLIVGPYLGLALSQKDYESALRHCKVPRSEWGQFVNDGSDATMHTLTNPDGGMVCIVGIRPGPKHTGPQIAAMLVHEAVHVWQAWRSKIGEREPSIEFEAYSIQTISQRLMCAYAESISK